MDVEIEIIPGMTTIIALSLAKALFLTRRQAMSLQSPRVFPVFWQHWLQKDQVTGVWTILMTSVTQRLLRTGLSIS